MAEEAGAAVPEHMNIQKFAGTTFLNSNIQYLIIRNDREEAGQGAVQIEPAASKLEHEKKEKQEPVNAGPHYYASDDNVEESGKPKTVLEQILIAQTGAISDCFKRSNDFQAHGILLNLHKLGPSVSRLPLMIDYYAILMKTERGEEANRLVNEIYGVLRQKLIVNPKACKRLAKRFLNSKNYFKSILFDLLGNIFLPELKDNEKILFGIRSNMTRLHKSIDEACEKSPSHKKTIRLWVLPRVRRSLQIIFSKVKGKSKKDLTIAQVACKHKLELCEGEVDDTDAREITLTEGIELMRSVLGQEAKEISFLGTLLNNLGVNCLAQKRLQEAKDYLAQAIGANMSAHYDSMAEKESHIKISNRLLDRVEEMLVFQT